MKKQSRQRTFRKFMIAYSIFEMLLCSGPIFGWASLAYILKKENYFADVCTLSSNQNSSSINGDTFCRAQENKLNIAYTVGFLTVGLVSLPVGYLLDTFGPKVTRYASSALFGVSAAFWINFSKDTQYLIYPAILTLSAAGVFSSFAFFQVSAFYCHKNQSTVLGLQNGAFNASAVMLHVIKILYELQKFFRLEVLLALYCGISSILVLCATFIFVPSKKDLLSHITSRSIAKDALCEEKAELDCDSCQMMQENGNCEANGCGGNNGSLALENRVGTNEDNFIAIKLDDAPILKRISLPNEMNTAVQQQGCSKNSIEIISTLDEMKLTAFNILLKGSKLSINTFVDISNDKQCEVKEQKPTLRGILFSGFFLWHQFFSSIFHLHLYYFIATFESLLLSIQGSNEAIDGPTSKDHVQRIIYINILGIAQFVGVIFAPMLGPYIDKNPRKQMMGSFEDYRLWKIKRCGIALAITMTINLLMGAVVLIPVIEAQVVAIAAQVILRGFFYAIHFTYFAVIFPAEHYGKLTCLSLLIGVIMGSLQYPLCLLTERKFGNNPFWVNVGLLALSMLAYGQPLHLRKYLKQSSA